MDTASRAPPCPRKRPESARRSWHCCAPPEISQNTPKQSSAFFMKPAILNTQRVCVNLKEAEEATLRGEPRSLPKPGSRAQGLDFPGALPGLAEQQLPPLCPVSAWALPELFQERFGFLDLEEHLPSRKIPSISPITPAGSLTPSRSCFATQGRTPRPCPQLRNACLVPHQKLRGSTTSSRQRKLQFQHLSSANPRNTPISACPAERRGRPAPSATMPALLPPLRGGHSAL